MSDSLIGPVIAILAVPLSIFLTWLVNRKKNVADVLNAISSGSHNVVESMQISMEAMQDRVTEAERLAVEAKGHLNELTQIMNRTQYELSQLRQQNMMLLQENHALRRKVEAVAKRVDTGEIPVVSEDDPQDFPSVAL